MRRLLVAALVVALTVLAPTAQADVSGVTVDNATPSNAAGAKTSYVIGFTTSATGGLSGTAGDHITISLPPGTNTATIVTTMVRDTTANPAQTIGNCTTAGLTITCQIFSGQTIAANHVVAVTLNGVTNPGTPAAQTLSVSTTSDPSPVTSSKDRKSVV